MRGLVRQLRHDHGAFQQPAIISSIPMRLSLFHSFENQLNASYDSSPRNIRFYVSQDIPESVSQGPLTLDFIHSDNSDWAHCGASIRLTNSWRVFYRSLSLLLYCHTSIRVHFFDRFTTTLLLRSTTTFSVSPSSTMAPPNRLARLPTWISHWLGYRSSPAKKQPVYIIYLWSFTGAFCGLSVLQAIFGHAHYFIDRHVPSIVASYVCPFHPTCSKQSLTPHRAPPQSFAMASSTLLSPNPAPS